MSVYYCFFIVLTKKTKLFIVEIGKHCPSDDIVIPKKGPSLYRAMSEAVSRREQRPKHVSNGTDTHCLTYVATRFHIADVDMSQIGSHLETTRGIRARG